MDLNTTCCDVLEFDVSLVNKDGTAFTLDAGDKLWFAVAKSYKNKTPLVYVEQTATHFKINGKEHQILPGTYYYEVGILFADDTERTVITGKLNVANKIKEHDHDSE